MDQEEWLDQQMAKKPERPVEPVFETDENGDPICTHGYPLWSDCPDCRVAFDVQFREWWKKHNHEIP